MKCTERLAEVQTLQWLALPVTRDGGQKLSFIFHVFLLFYKNVFLYLLV